MNTSKRSKETAMLFYINRAQQCRTTWSSLLPIEGQFTPSHYDTEAQIRDKLQRQPLNSWVDQGGAPGRKITRAVDSWDCGCITPPLSLTQAFHNNKPSTRGDETIWTWTSEENMPCFLIIPTLTDQSVFPPSILSETFPHDRLRLTLQLHNDAR